MNLHEYQAKQLFVSYQIPTPRGCIAKNASDIRPLLYEMGGDAFVLKAQIHAGGRAKAGGVLHATGHEEAYQKAFSLLGKQLVTHQTDHYGQPVHAVLIEPKIKFVQEYYMSFFLDKKLARLMLMISKEGGIDIEKTAKEFPEKIHQIEIDPLVGIRHHFVRELAIRFGLNEKLERSLSQLIKNCLRLFVEEDLALLEINPLVVTSEHKFLCLDAKVSMDDNALFRHPEFEAWEDRTQLNPIENQAKEIGLQYVELDGNIACMVNGAGLAMATMDLIQHYGAFPANFLDVGGNVSSEQVYEALRIILSKSDVSAIFINIFGGIVQCDLIADGIQAALSKITLTVPIVIRFCGNNAEIGLQKLENFDLIFPLKDLEIAVKKVVELAR